MSSGHLALSHPDRRLSGTRVFIFSADLMIRRGKADGIILDSDWDTEINGIGRIQVPDPERLGQLKKDLALFSPGLVAAGHGPCIRLK